jgi:hypothetical protein
MTLPVYGQERSLQITRVSEPPRIDGVLDDSVWQKTPPATNFTKNFPDFGSKASRESEVRILYDNEAIYVGAWLFDSSANIRKQLTTRDAHEFQDADNFGVSFDTYGDRQNAFQFIVTSANVQSDIRISAQNGDGGFDANWDAVWDSRTSFSDKGWCAEMKIPFSALRFSQDSVQAWRLNFSRFIRKENETAFWNPVNPNVGGFVNQFGKMEGLVNVKPPLRLFFLPYFTGGYRTVPTNSGIVNNSIHNGGMDIKYGISESFTMDMTLIPDFGQVVSDNVILNLSAFEQQFNENRPFFTEGTELFNKAGIFYSRRIGKTPADFYQILQLAADSGYTILKNPSLTQLYNATKISGRTNKNLGIGVFNAVTAPMEATLENDKGDIIKKQTEPLTNYNILVIDKALKNRSFITFTNSNVLRSGQGYDANVSALDISFFDSSNTYNFFNSSKVSYITLDENRFGWANQLGFRKVSGKWQWGFSNNIESRYYNPNDLGFLRSPNELTNEFYVNYNQFTPTNTFNFRQYSFSISQTNLLEPLLYSETNVSVNLLHVFKNFWDLSFNVYSSPFWSRDFFDLRTGNRPERKMPFVYFGLNGSTDSRKKLCVNYALGFADLSPVKNDPYYTTTLGARYRFSPKFSLSFNEMYSLDAGNFGFATFDAQTGEPVIGRRRIDINNTLISGVYNFKARMNITMRMRHYWSKVVYQSFFDVDSKGYWIPREFIEDQDDNFNAFNLDAFFTWDFRLGSRLIVAWKNALGPDVFIDGSEFGKYGSNLREVMLAPHSNEFSVKFIYFIDYLQLKRS